jgi:hypothetical protein
MILFAFLLCAAIDIAGLVRDDAANRWNHTRAKWADARKRAQDTRTERGHRRLRDQPKRAFFAAAAGVGWAGATFREGWLSGWRRRHQALADFYDRRGWEQPKRLTKAINRRKKKAQEKAEQQKADQQPTPVPSIPPQQAPPNVLPIRPNLSTVPTNPTPAPTNPIPATRPTTRGVVIMPEVTNLEQLKAVQKAVEDAARVNLEDKQADLNRAKADLQNMQTLSEGVTAIWPDSTAAAYQRMVEDRRLNVDAALRALAAAEQWMASVNEAKKELNKQIAAEEAARAAGWNGVRHGAPVLTN